MSHFFGTVRGQTGEASRVGGKYSGIRTTASTYGSVVSVRYTHEELTGLDRVRVSIETKHGNNHRTIMDVTDADGLAAVAWDPKIAFMLDKVTTLFERIEAEIPKAKRRQKRANKARQRIAMAEAAERAQDD